MENVFRLGSNDKEHDIEVPPAPLDEKRETAHRRL